MRNFGLIGKSLGHSFSKNYFTDKFQNLGIVDATYELYPFETVDELRNIIAKVPQLVGLNVTIPYKETVIPFLDELDETAAAVGAVNCIKISADGKLKGYNTDTFGFQQSIKPFLSPQHEKALILGTGGAAKAVAYVLDQIGIDYHFVSRVAKSGQLTYEALNDNTIKFHQLLINTTPLGTFPNVNEIPPIPTSAIGENHLVIDLIYNPERTLLLQKAAAQGASVLNGYSMLKEQAEKAWLIWNS